jgi:hypothetical protein
MHPASMGAEITVSPQVFWVFGGIEMGQNCSEGKFFLVPTG